MTTASTQDEELAKFGRLADLWWDPEGDMRTLHDINPLRLSYISDRTRLNNARVADIGCGAGILSESLAQCDATVTAMDLSPDMIEVARDHAGQSGLSIDYRQTDSRTLADELAGTFDVVTCMELLEHVDDPAGIVNDCARLLRPGGMAFFSTLNRTPKARLLAIGAAEYLLNLLPRGTHEYDKFIRPSELGFWARDSGLRIESIDGMRYNPLTHHARLETRPEVNYFIHASRPEHS